MLLRTALFQNLGSALTIIPESGQGGKNESRPIFQAGDGPRGPSDEIDSDCRKWSMCKHCPDLDSNLRYSKRMPSRDIRMNVGIFQKEGGQNRN
jgi:hypothetical protein